MWKILQDKLKFHVGVSWEVETWRLASACVDTKPVRVKKICLFIYPRCQTLSAWRETVLFFPFFCLEIRQPCSAERDRREEGVGLGRRGEGGDLQKKGTRFIVTRLFVCSAARGGYTLFSSSDLGNTKTPSILDFLIRFLSSRMRFKRNGSYTLNR